MSLELVSQFRTGTPFWCCTGPTFKIWAAYFYRKNLFLKVWEVKITDRLLIRPNSEAHITIKLEKRTGLLRTKPQGQDCSIRPERGQLPSTVSINRYPSIIIRRAHYSRRYIPTTDGRMSNRGMLSWRISVGK